MFIEPSPPFKGIGIATAKEIWSPLDRYSALSLSLDRTGGTVRPLTKEAASWINRLVVDEAYQWIYEHPDDTIAATFLPLPERPLVVVGDNPIFARRKVAADTETR